jgi:hypothetical protein
MQLKIKLDKSPKISTNVSTNMIAQRLAVVRLWRRPERTYLMILDNERVKFPKVRRKTRIVRRLDYEGIKGRKKDNGNG